MMIRFQAMHSAEVRRLQGGGRDTNEQLPERKVSDGGGVPCRHCLSLVPKGRPYLVLSHRPFATVQPYAEQGPIFLCADECPDGSTVEKLPEFLKSERYIVRGYDADERIAYGTGQIISTAGIMDYCRELLDHEGIDFLHIRSATNNCYHVRVERTVAFS